ncbi:MerR family transcriptional regulator [Kribbella sp. NBC_01245]|uniref:MerR family transcriptional regulator n=1 Tax=Kribbella sp. NBC_01245 TaxID=2903578 RepID=UPI002E2CB058|nr:MerR family transcriptional regulator [Kribbella sp. NBC_01245]
MTATALRSGQVAAAAGVNLQTLRYYERRGLLAEPNRSPGGHRLYPPEAVTILRVIKASQRLGFTLEEIADLLVAAHHHGRTPHSADGIRPPALPRVGAGGRSEEGLQVRARQKLADVEAKIADLTVIVGTLREALEVGCDDLIECAQSPNCPLPFSGLATGGTATD